MTEDPNKAATLVCAFVLVIALFFVAWSHSAHDCEARHGVLVRGTLWFACVKAP